MTIPRSQPTLAALTAAEWESQDKVLKSFSLPLTSIVVRATDSFPDQEIRQGVIDNLLKYVHTDTVCYLQSYPDSLVKLQDTYWTPLIDWLRDAHKIEMRQTEGILHVRQTDDTIQKLRSVIEKYSDIKLAAFEKAVMRSKSFIIGFALIERAVSVEFATHASLVEVNHQIQRWGEVEDSHDTDREDLKRQLGAATCALLQ